MMKTAWALAFLSFGFCGMVSAASEPPSAPRWLEKLPARFVTAYRLSPAAEEAGIEKEDVVLTLGGSTVTTNDQLWKAVRGAPQDGETALRVLRKGAELEFNAQSKPYMLGVDHINLFDQYRRVGKMKPEWDRLARGAFEHQLACRWQKAVESLEKLVGQKSGTGLAAPRLLRHLSWLYLHLPDFKKAEAALDRSRKISPDDAGTLALLSCLYAWTGRPRAAKVLLARLDVLAPRSVSREGRRMIESQLKWFDMHERRSRLRKEGKLPSRADPRTPTRRIELTWVDEIHEPKTLRAGPGGYAEKRFDEWLGDFVFRAQMHLHPPRGWGRLPPRGGVLLAKRIWASREYGPFDNLFDVDYSGSVRLKMCGKTERLTISRFAKPMIDVMVVREGCRFEYHIDGIHLFTFFMSDSPVFLWPFAHGTTVEFLNAETTVPTRAGIAPDDEEGEVF